jgi:hypothetical protein
LGERALRAWRMALSTVKVAGTPNLASALHNIVSSTL